VRWISKLLTVVFLVFAGVAWGQECTVSATPVSFGQYISNDPSPVYGEGSVRVRCPVGTGFTVRLDPGKNSGGSFHARKLRSATSGKVLNYNLYRDSAHAEVWGDGTSNTYVQAGVGMGVDVILIVYGRLLGRQNAGGGIYSDPISVTVEW